ncbi:MAG: YcxB family protein [Saccharofermentanales bacterium]
MEVKAITAYDFPCIKEFVRFTLFKGKGQNITGKKIGLVVLMSVVFCLSLINMIINSFEAGIIVFFITLMIICIFGYLYFIYPKKVYKSAKKLASMKNEYLFQEDEFTMTSDNPEFSGKSTMKYTFLNMVYETEDYFYLFIDKAQAYIVRKSDITNGTSEQIRETIIYNMPPEKYIICK